jgi:dTDP-4-dehydrorhamnose 3,5-epimerase-like enzyme
VEYKCTTFYDSNDEIHLRWDDPDIDLKWPVDDPLLSTRDRSARFLRDDFERLPAFESGSQ